MAGLTSFLSRLQQSHLCITDDETGKYCLLVRRCQNCACDWSTACERLRGTGGPAQTQCALFFLRSGYMMVLKMQLMLGAFLFLNVCGSLVSALYFHIGETEKKCFIEEIPDETMIIGECVKEKVFRLREMVC